MQHSIREEHLQLLHKLDGRRKLLSILSRGQTAEEEVDVNEQRVLTLAVKPRTVLYTLRFDRSIRE